MHERKLVPRILAHIKSGSPDCPLSPSESLEVATLAYRALKLPCPSDVSPEAGQPYRLHLLQALANSWGDPLAISRVALPPSLQWPAKKPDSALPPDLEICEGNWKMAEDEPETVQGLLRNEIANNWIVETSLSIADAREKWPLGIGVNTRCRQSA